MPDQEKPKWKQALDDFKANGRVSQSPADDPFTGITLESLKKKDDSSQDSTSGVETSGAPSGPGPTEENPFSAQALEGAGVTPAQPETPDAFKLPMGAAYESIIDTAVRAYDAAHGEGAAETISAFANDQPDDNVYDPETVERSGNRAGYVYNKFLQGVGGIAAQFVDYQKSGLIGATPSDAFRLLQTVTNTNTELEEYRNGGAERIRNYLKDRIGADVDKGRERKYQNEFFTESIGALAQSAPAMIGPSPLRAANMFLLATDGAMQSLQNADSEGKVSQLEKTIYASTVGLVTGALEHYGFSKVLKGKSPVLARAIVNKSIKEAAEESGGRITGDILQKFIDKNTKGLIRQYAKTGVRALNGFMNEFETEATQEAATIGSEYLLNAAKGEEIFDTSDTDSWEGFIKRVATAGAMGGIGGGILGGGLGAINEMANPDRRTRAEQMKRTMDTLAETIDLSGTSDASTEAISQEIATIEEGIDEEIGEDKKETKLLTGKEWATRYKEISGRLSRLDGVLNDETVPASLKEGMQEEFDSLKDEMKKLFDEASKQEAATEGETAPEVTEEQKPETTEDEAAPDKNTDNRTLVEDFVKKGEITLTSEQTDMAASLVGDEFSIEEAVNVAQTPPEKIDQKTRIRMMNDPVELASMYSDEIAERETQGSKEDAIAAGILRMPREDFEKGRDRNNITGSIARNYFSRKSKKEKGFGADVQAQQINETYFGGEEIVTPEDIYDFIEAHPEGPETRTTPAGNETLKAISDRYKNLTGKGINRTIARKLATKRTQAGEKLTANPTVIPEELVTFISDEGITAENLDNFKGAIEFIYNDIPDAFERIKKHINERGTNQRAENEGGGQTTGAGPDGRSVRTDGGEPDSGGTNEPGGEPSPGGSREINPDDEVPFSFQASGKTTRASRKEINSADSPVPLGTFTENTGRIQPEPIVGKKPRKINEIIGDLAKGLGATITYNKPKTGRRGFAGVYIPRSALVAIRNAGDLDVTIHEIGHMLSDYLGFRKALEAENTTGILKEALDLSQYGSNPPGSASKAAQARYRIEEGIAEFTRAWAFNPSVTARRYPELTKLFEANVPEDIRKVLEKFSEDVRVLEGSTAHERTMANVHMEPVKDKKSLLSTFTKGNPATGEFSLTFRDRFNQKIVDANAPLYKAFKWAADMRGQTKFAPEHHVELMSRLFAGVNAKVEAMLTSGLTDGRNNSITDEVTGENVTLQWVLGATDKNTAETVRQEMEEATSYMIAKRTVELADRFDRESLLTGIGFGLHSDLSVARKRVEEVESGDPRKADRLKETARRYQVFADGLMQYMVDKGRMSVDQYELIKENNAEYIALSRLIETGPDQEAVQIIQKGPSGKLGVSREVIKKIKGSSAIIKNPFVSLIDLAYKEVTEADRNQIMQEFVSLLEIPRNIGDGDPIRLSSIGSRVAEAGNNTVTVFRNGEKEYWQFTPEVFRSIKNLEETPNLPGVLTVMARVLRWTVTNWPVFAARNIVRDTQSRMVNSRGDSNPIQELMNFRPEEGMAESFSISGGDQGGRYMKSKEAYYDRLNRTIRGMAENHKFILLDPSRMKQNLWDDGYKKFLEGAEKANRLAEYKKQFAAAKKEGLDDYNAGLYAAFQARDLMDFAVAGQWVKIVNQVIPFTNAHVQGLKNMIIRAKEDPMGFAAKLSLYQIMPAVLTRVFVHMMDKDDEYEQFPSYMKDSFYMIPFGDTWLSIPKSYEYAVAGALTNRAIAQHVYDQDHSFDGFAETAGALLLNFDTGALAGPFSPIIEATANYDFFRQQNIVPGYEEGLAIELRDGMKRASRLGQILSNFSNVDARKIDHVIRNVFSYYGAAAINFSNLGRDDTMLVPNVHMLGFSRDFTPGSARDVDYLDAVASELRLTGDRQYKAIRKKIREYYALDDKDSKQELKMEIIQDAKDLREKWNEDFQKERIEKLK